MDLRSKRIAVVGASADETKYGYKIFRDLLAAGSQADGVNPRGGMVCGKSMYPSLSALSYTPDLVITVVPPAVTDKVVDECLGLGIKTIWMQPGSGSPAAVEKAEHGGMEVIHDACIMIQEGIW